MDEFTTPGELLSDEWFNEPHDKPKETPIPERIKRRPPHFHMRRGWSHVVTHRLMRGIAQALELNVETAFHLKPLLPKPRPKY
jgi:hypothetical protein